MTRRILGIGWAAGLVLVTGLSGGCVSQAEYDKVVAANRRANEQLLQSQKTLESKTSQIDQLREQLSERDAALRAMRQENRVLEQAKKDLQDSFNKLEDLYEKAMARPTGPEELPPFTLPPKLDEALRAFAEQNPALVEYMPEYGMLKLKSDELTFARGSDEVQPGAKEALQRLVEIMQSQAAKDFHVYVAGHTDNIPIQRAETKRRHPNNWYLSVHRAVAVEKALDEAGLAPERIGVMGFSKYHPIVPNKPDQGGNPQNRRVEIWVVSPERFLTQPAVTGAGEAEGQ